MTFVTHDGGHTATHALLLAAASDLLRSLLQELPDTEEHAVIILPDFSDSDLQLCLDIVMGGSTQGVDRLILETLGMTRSELEKYEVGFKSEELDPAHFLLVQTKVEPSEESDLKHDNDEFVETGSSVQDNNIGCIYCSEKFLSYKIMQNHVSTAHNLHNLTNELSSYIEQEGDKSTCAVCKVYFDSEMECFEHLKINHKQGSNWECLQCGKQYPSGKKYKIHLKNHMTTKHLTCDLCGKAFPKKNLLKTHHMKIHASEEERNKEKKFVCTICGRGFYKQAFLTDHELIHLEYDSFFCDMCGYGTKTKDGMRLHKKTKHEGKYVLTEQQREAAKARKMKARALQREKNGGSLRTPEEKAKYNEYMKEYQAKKRMNNHKSLVKQKDIVCDLCGKAFHNDILLQTHHIKVHASEEERTREKKFVCTTCGQGFYKKNSLAKHHVRIHGPEKEKE